jgi:hypothetical protein
MQEAGRLVVWCSVYSTGEFLSLCMKHKTVFNNVKHERKGVGGGDDMMFCALRRVQWICHLMFSPI